MVVRFLLAYYLRGNYLVFAAVSRNISSHDITLRLTFTTLENVIYEIHRPQTLQGV